jgi:hypothetical protein
MPRTYLVSHPDRLRITAGRAWQHGARRPAGAARSTVDVDGPPVAERMGYLNGEVTVAEAGQILRESGSVLVVDWPSQDVPETLTRAGYTVLGKGGPEPDNYRAYEVRDGEVVSRRTGEAPVTVDLVYSYRPVGELPGIVAMAQRLGASQGRVAPVRDGQRRDKGAGWLLDGPGVLTGGTRSGRVGRPGLYRGPLHRR